MIYNYSKIFNQKKKNLTAIFIIVAHIRVFHAKIIEYKHFRLAY